MKQKILSIVLLFFFLLTVLGNAAAANAGTVKSDSGSYQVLVICFDPVFPMANNKKQHDLVDWWNDPHDLAKGFIADMKEISHGYANYEICDWIELDEMPKTEDGKAYTVADYYSTLQKASDSEGGAYWNYSGWKDWGFSFDYDYYLTKYDVYKRVDSGEIDEVWFFTGPCIGATLYETRMFGKGAFWCNSPGFEKDCRLFVAYGFNYERGIGEMLEDAGHRAEFILDDVFGWPDYSKPYGQYTDWEKFTVYDILNPGKSGVGNIHYAPNSLSDYDWGNKRYVDSYCLDWVNYPNLTGKSQSVNCSTWRNGDTRLHHKWWFTLLPHAPGVNEKSGKLNNWWPYFTLDYINAPEKNRCGDADGNGQVNTTDVILIRRFIAGGYNVTIDENAADVDGNGVINTTDVILIRRCIAGGYDVVLRPGKVV